MRGIQFEQMMRLRTLNQFAGRLAPMVQAPDVTPFQMYLELRELLGELAALHPDRDQFDAPAYDHDNPAVAFNGTVRQDSLACCGARWRRGSSRCPSRWTPRRKMLVAASDRRAPQPPNEYFLGIKTRLDPRSSASLWRTPTSSS